jgi:phage terminase small subunit
MSMTAEPIESREPEKQDWGELGPAMQALTEMKRNFVRALVTDAKPGHGALTRAAAVAGFGKNSKRATLSKHAHHLSRDEKAIAAIAEESRKVIRVGHPEAVAALFNLVRNPEHRDHARALAMVIDRCDPTVTKHSVDVTHRTIDPDREALEELQALRQLGATREKLLEFFGPNGLDRLEALEAVENAQRAAQAKVIEHEPSRD